MASAKHLERLQQGVEEWNRWKEKNSKIKPDLSGADLSGAYLQGADLSGANLNRADLSGVNLHEARLNGATLNGANLSNADLSSADLSDADLTGTKLLEANLLDTNLCHAKLCEANLDEADLSYADLNYTNLLKANLNNANLSNAQVLRANFEKTILTGACLEDWNTNSATRFEGTSCDYVYLASNQRERRPREGTFKPGEFAALFQQAVDTVDLIFTEGIDWQAFFQSFQDLRSQYADENLSIQAIEKKQGGAFVVRLEVSEGADKASIESSAKELYKAQLKTLEAQYEKQLRFQGEQHSEEIQRLIEAERQEKATLLGVLTTMASQQGPKYDLRGAQIAGGFAESVQGDQVGGTINTTAAETHSLAQAAAEIQNLLKQLEALNSAATEAQQTAYLDALIPPAQREWFIAALQSAGNAVIDDVPYGPLLKALVEGWQKPNG